jgi:hypothetical protein
LSVTVRVFVSYRRQGSQHAAGRLGKRLDERFRLLMHVDRIRPDADFTAVTRAAVDQTDVLPALGGQRDDSAWNREIKASLGLGDQLRAALVIPAGCLTNLLLHELTLRLKVRRRYTVTIRDLRLVSRHVGSWLIR